VKLPAFQLERFFARYEFKAPHLLCCSDCESYHLEQILALEEGAGQTFNQLWLGYTESSGDPELRRQIAGLYDNVSPDQILVHAGAEEAIFNFMNTVLVPDDHIIVHWPGYQSLRGLAESVGCQVTPWLTHPDSGWELDLDYLERHLQPNTKVVVVNCPHNPTGYLMDTDAFRNLVSLSQRHGFIIFSDEVYRYLEYADSERLPALCDIDDRGVSLGVMSKSFGLAGLRIGWIATRNSDIYKQLAAFKDYTTICNSAPSEYLAALALRHKEKILERNRTIVEQNLSILNAFFYRYPETFKWVPPGAGPIAFPEMLAPDDTGAFCRDLVEKTGVLLLPGSCYDPDYANHFRIGFGRKQMPECVEKLETYLRRTGAT